MKTCHVRGHEDYCGAAEAEIRRMAGAVGGADMALMVPTCPEWTLYDLIDHAGSVHRWAAHMVEHRSAERVPGASIEMDKPDDRDAMPGWLDAGAAIVGAAFRSCDPDTPMWAWGADKHARFWPRRMLFETTIHRADAEFAVGAVPSIDEDVATDGIDEFLDNLPHAAYFSPTVAELTGSGEALAFDAGSTQWRIELGPDGFAWSHEDGSGAEARISAAAADLLLVLYGRRPLNDPGVTVEGHQALVDRWLTNAKI